MDQRKLLQSCMARLERLRSDRAEMLPLWRDLAEYHLGRRGRFLSGDGNSGSQRNRVHRNTRQYNNKSKMAVRTLSSGMMTGITSPARPWFKLGSGNPELDEYRAVKDWLHIVEQRMYKVFGASNFYNAMHMLYTNLGVFGTPCMGVYQDYDNIIRCCTDPIGSYMLDLGGNDKIDTRYREYQRTVGQLVKEFGKENCSAAVQKMWDNGNTEHLVDVVHVIEPNDDRDMLSPLAQDMPFRSLYFEKGVSRVDGNLFLRISGFKQFPVMAPRWDVDGEDVYATDCPGITALGDTKALQLGEKRQYQALDKVSDPPLQGSAAVANKSGERAPLPGTVTTLGQNDKGLSSIYGNYGPDLNAIVTINDRTEMRVSRAFYEDLFLMMIGSDRRQITATEVAERHEEKLLALGPVLERLHSELLDPVIDRVFNIMVESGQIPPAPREMQGRELSVEYISILAQAQRMVAISGIERTTAFVANASAIWPEARHKIDIMQAVDEYGHAMGVSPKVVRADEDAEALQAGDMQAAAQAQQMQQLDAMAGAVQKAANAKLTDPSALTQALAGSGLM